MTRAVVGALLVVLALAAPVHAEFTAAEKEQAVLLVEATRQLTAALRALAIPIREGRDSATRLKAGVGYTRMALYDMHRAMSNLMNQGGSSFEVPLASDRARKLAAAWFYLDRVDELAGSAMSALAGAVDEDAKAAAKVALPRARFYVRSFDRSLKYTLPGTGRIVGPHGDFNRGIWHLQRAWGYGVDFLEKAFKDYPNGSDVDWFKIVNSTPGLFNTFSSAMLRIANIDTSSAQAAMREQLEALPGGELGARFWLILGLGEVMSSGNLPGGGLGVPAVYHGLQGAFHECGSYYCGLARLKLTDSWKHSDSAVWWIIGAFPGCDLQENPLGCAQKLPSQQQ
jgi:hypothetical protein